MTKTQLIDALSQRSGVDKSTVKTLLEELTGLIHDTVKEGGEVKLQDLGKFKRVERKARMGRNPATGEPIQIPAKTAVKFYPAKALKGLA